MLIAAIDSFAAFIAVGLVAVLMRRSMYDIHGARLRGIGTEIALVLTISGRSRPLVGLGLLSIAIFAVARWPLWIPLAVSASQIVSQSLVEGIKRIFKRVRPDDWLVRAERGYSYPSGHSATAVTFYASWAVVAWLSPLPDVARFTLTLLLMAWAVGVAWSRLALRAHYVTDVVGGWLFGTAWLCLMLVVYQHVKSPALLPGFH